MKALNRHFGILDYEEKHLIRFPEGIIGFEDCKNFVIIDDESTEPFRWLVCVENEDIAFPLLDPATVIADYYHRTTKSEHNTVFVVATLRDPTETSTINLRSPIVIDHASRTGKQVILDDDSLSVHYQLIEKQHDGENE